MLAPYKFPDLTPLGDVKPRTFTPDLDGLIAWLRTQDGATEYNADDARSCLFARFHTAIGEPVRISFSLGDENLDQLYSDAFRIASGRMSRADDMRKTYSAALSRALSLRSESPVGGKVGL